MCLCHINYMTQYLLPNWVNTKTNILSINIYYHEAREHIHHTWHSLRVPPDCTKSSTITTCRPSGFPSFIRTILLSPSRTLLQTIYIIKQPNMKSMTRKHKKKGSFMTICIPLYNTYKVCELDISKHEKETTDHWKVLQELVEPLPRPIIWEGNCNLQATCQQSGLP